MSLPNVTQLCGGTITYHVMGSRGFEALDTWADTERRIVAHAGNQFMDMVETIERYHLNQET